MKNRTATIAHYTVLEALRTRLPLILAIVLAAVLAASFFVREIAITESTRFQTAFYAATMRLAAVFLAALYVIASVAREFQDKGLDMVLALDLPRTQYVTGKLSGFVLIAVAVALAAGIPLLPLAGWEAGAQWSISLAFELAVIVALALFCVLTFNQLMPAASVVMAFYVLARAITAVRLIGANPVADADTLSHQFMTTMVETLALVLPALDQWTRTTWLVDMPGEWIALAAIAAHALLFVVIFGAAAVFDLSRRNF